MMKKMKSFFVGQEERSATVGCLRDEDWVLNQREDDRLLYVEKTHPVECRRGDRHPEMQDVTNFCIIPVLVVS